MEIKLNKKCIRITKHNTLTVNTKRKYDADEMTRIPYGTKFNLRPILVLLALGGCYSLQGNNRKCLSTLLLLYKGLLVVVILLYTIRNASYLKDITSLLFSLTNLLVSFQTIGNILFSWKTFSAKYGHYRRTMQKFENVLSEMAINSISISTTYFNRRCLGIIILAVAILLISIVGQAGVAFVFVPIPDGHEETLFNQTFSYTQPFKDGILTRCVLFFVLVLQLLPYILPGYFLLAFSIMILSAFKSLNKHLISVSESGEEKMFDNLENLRQIHQGLCSSVICFDNDFGYLFGNNVLWTVIEGILVLYVYVKYTIPLLVQMIILYYLVMGFSYLALVCTFAALVHEAAHSPLDVIYNIKVRQINLEKAVQLNLFLSKLTGTHVGFTTFGLLIITKEFILTIIGAFLTYFAVLYTL